MSSNPIIKDFRERFTFKRIYKLVGNMYLLNFSLKKILVGLVGFAIRILNVAAEKAVCCIKS